MVDNLRRRGLASLNILDICVMCGKDSSSINHLFIHCEVATNISSNFIGRCGLAWCCSKNITELVECWLDGCFKGLGGVFWSMFAFATFWSTWKERNDRISRSSSSTTTYLIVEVAIRIAKWGFG
eukprot:TRINITY_DN9111_c2_g1_i2.p1 TRINITY_DN9111_c2_g1~~TRINITY_DN9111_c2_g1_i2.p1  ORF type:complete len:125 (-),score=11.96 TRINITY_DN9111_c2_g1_i2:821-1195(-)